MVEEFHQEAENLRAEIEHLATRGFELEQKLEESQKAPKAPQVTEDVEALKAEIQQLRQKVDQLEDERSDLEIVNIDLLQQLTETESKLEQVKNEG